MTEASPDPDDVIMLHERGRWLQAALAHLTAEERQAIETTFFAGLTYAEAAARLGQPLGTIKTRIRSGLTKLRHRLEGAP
jgi:RNA polymerase sigma-70 factor, ECF subfamily